MQEDIVEKGRRKECGIGRGFPQYQCQLQTMLRVGIPAAARDTRERCACEGPDGSDVCACWYWETTEEARGTDPRKHDYSIRERR